MDDDRPWYKDAIIYELHVRAFSDSTGDGVGDFIGLTNKLDYLQGLGVTCLWLLPFYPSPLKDDGYDISNYESVHPAYGTLKDFRVFLREAHERGLRVITELVINHTSDQHPWFQAARRAPAGSSKRDYYVWSETTRRYEDARIIFTDSEPSNWTWDPEASAYYWHRFFRHQPDLNFDNPRVRRAVRKWMKFWFDMGVDGLRLDAIPYLCEREGTSCENLTETHAFLKEIREELDVRYSDRMLLAEANQWPADVRAYFGDGDECHMAFHFPLMPRMFMALVQEDRYPIVDILRQTPEIPEACQWALFLRNHDELTLEMVTANERDYMYRAYASDPQMRLNVGIRRRLAPLVENNRDRIELLYGLLLSMPGTPILYYGDEIGMGDNIYLGDRNGVRTPMQWTGDRNAGFSRADPARLYAPPVMDPVYGYQAINVEAQERSPFSLLNWVRRTIGVRRQHHVFGRGTIELVNGSNRAVLAYVRQLADEIVLVVANLSRGVQPVELPLERFAGLVPVEMRDRTAFPRLGTQPYFLSMAPYGFYWFKLQPSADPAVSARSGVPAVAAARETRPALLASGDWEAIFAGTIRRLIERDYLLPYLVGQRWFPGKARVPVEARIADWGLLQGGLEPSFLLLLDVTYQDGGVDRLFVPVSLASGDGAAAIEAGAPDRVLARISGAREGIIHDLIETEAVRLITAAILDGRGFALHGGRAEGGGTTLRQEVHLAPPDALKVSRLGAEQSNTSFIVGGDLILKVIRRVEAGVNPEVELGYHLTERVHFARVPPLVGALEYVDRNGLRTTLAILDGLVEHQINGWEQAITGTRRYYDRALASGRTPPDDLLQPVPIASLAHLVVPPLVLDTLGGYLDNAAVLGTRTAELHLALAHPGGADIDPRPFAAADRESLKAAMRAHADTVFDTLAAQLDRVPARLRAATDRLLDERGQLLQRFSDMTTLAPEIDVIRVHGDFHLGQVLIDKGDFIILDFEGEPARAMAERRSRQPALKDVAGMLRSFSYAAYAGLFAYTADQPAELERLEPWARLGQTWTAAAFLKTYRATAGAARFLPARTEDFQALLDLMLLDKVIYELGYELNHRPDWLRIPLSGLIQQLAG